MVPWDNLRAPTYFFSTYLSYLYRNLKLLLLNIRALNLRSAAVALRFDVKTVRLANCGEFNAWYFTHYVPGAFSISLFSYSLTLKIKLYTLLFYFIF